MNGFRRFALAATISVYFLIFFGGLVRVSGAGLGCPDWPKCFDRWIPPTSIAQLPEHIDPDDFNFALAWIEYVNRLIGVMVGIFVAGTAIWALRRYTRHLTLVIPASLAAILVAYQGWQGGQMIEARLEANLVSLHMGLAFIIALLSTYVTQKAWYLQAGKKPSVAHLDRGIRIGMIGLIVVSVIQVVTGTQMRTAIEAAMQEYPLLPETVLLTRIPSWHMFHILLGVILTIIAWQVGARILRRPIGKAPLVESTAWTMMIVAAVQILIGSVLIMFDLAALLQLFHLLLSAVFVGLLVVLRTALRHEGETI